MNPDPALPIIQILQNPAPWWQIWLPFLGSIVVAGAALISVGISNATNRRAIAVGQQNIEQTNLAAESREWTKWRREKLTAHIEEFTALADDVAASLRGSITWKPSDTKRLLIEANNAQNPLLRIARNIELVVGTELKADLDDVIDRLKRLQFAVEHHISGFRDEASRGIAAGPEFMKIKEAADLVDSRIDLVLASTRAVLEAIGETASSKHRSPE